MWQLELADDVIGAAIDDWGSRLVAIPAGYAIGAWVGTLVGFLGGVGTDSRADLRDILGVVGGVCGLVVWVIFSFVVD